MSKHTPEPWVFESEPAYCSEIFGLNGESVCTFVDDPSEADVDRILSCVNACEGMTDPASVIAELKRQRDKWMAVAHEFDIDRQKLADERDELLAALEAAVDCGMVPTSSAKEWGVLRCDRKVVVADMIRDAISKAKEMTK